MMQLKQLSYRQGVPVRTKLGSVVLQLTFADASNELLKVSVSKTQLHEQFGSLEDLVPGDTYSLVFKTLLEETTGASILCLEAAQRSLSKTKETTDSLSNGRREQSHFEPKNLNTTEATSDVTDGLPPESAHRHIIGEPGPNQHDQSSVDSADAVAKLTDSYGVEPESQSAVAHSSGVKALNDYLARSVAAESSESKSVQPLTYHGQADYSHLTHAQSTAPDPDTQDAGTADDARESFTQGAASSADSSEGSEDADDFPGGGW
ncbi:hypothetical protein [Furfurilactobacillus rossiae]|nr:hypothetical protein [Furfurilactobacillus rossiae]